MFYALITDFLLCVHARYVMEKFRIYTGGGFMHRYDQGYNYIGFPQIGLLKYVDIPLLYNVASFPSLCTYR